MNMLSIKNVGPWWRVATTTLALMIFFLGCGDGGDLDAPRPAGPSKAYDRGPLQLTVSASADPITTAETLELHVEMILDDGYGGLFPAYPEPRDPADVIEVEGAIEAAPTFELVDYQDEDPVLLDDGRVARRRTYTLEPFLEGAYTIPPLEIRFGKEGEAEDTWLRMETDPIKITVASVLAPDAAPALEEIAGPVAVKNPTPWGWYAFWAFLIAALVGWGYYYRFVRVVPGPPPPPPVPPHKLALEALEALQREGLVEKGLYKTYYIRVSDVLRHYMEAQFGIPASERTTEEFLQELQHNALLGLQEQLLLKEFLRHCDLVKFAKATPTSENIQETFATCKQFIKDTAAAQKAVENPSSGGG